VRNCRTHAADLQGLNVIRVCLMQLQGANE